jgi:hypothetical protein
MHPAIGNEFRIFAHGETFDVDAFLTTATLRPDYLWRRGDQRRYACVESKHPTSGVAFHLGDGRTVPFVKQEQIAITYIQAHRDELQALARYPGVQTFILGLQYICELDESLLGFCIGPSRRLMRLALDVGIEPNYYVGLNRTNDSECADVERDAPSTHD